MTTGSVLAEAVATCSEVTVVHGEGDGAVCALAGVSLEIRAHERVALLGRSGSGKTTLLHALGGLVEPTSGSVEWHGRVSYVFQSANLLPYFTALENVIFAADLRGGDVEPVESAEGLLELCGLGERFDHLPSELSGGEAQRVAIARALAQRPGLMLCDEPTGHLDSDTAGRVLDLIDALQGELGFALVVASHDPAVASRYDRAVELVDGTVVGGDGSD